MHAGFFAPLELAAASKDPAKRGPECGACGLSQKCHSPKMPLDGEGRMRVMVVGEAPAREEDAAGVPFVGETGRYLRACLEADGVDLRRDLWAGNALRCRLPNSTLDDDRRVDYCQPITVRDIKEKRPHVVILLGAAAVKSVLGWLWKEDVGAVTRWAGWQIPSQEINAWVCPTFHPSHVMRQEKERPHERVLTMFFRRHLSAALGLEGRPWKNVPDYGKRAEVVVSPREAASRIAYFANRSGSVAFDYETTTLKPEGEHAEIYACGLSNGEETFAYPWTAETAQATAALLASEVPKLGWNLTFESRWTKAKLGFWPQNWRHDGMIGAHVLDNRSQVTSLKFQAFAQLGVGAYDAQVKPYLKSAGSNRPNRIREASLPKVLKYCAMDALLEHKLCKMQMKNLGV